ncbi:cellulose synthase/poly-beta-1,6-N-acetylglucosamine synthase-like glycosyltransferase [Paenibacillus cellulosilyticus]|uniref:Cellulose synthase/poly-beta-1,6-N-acetylglucosamine synthase-like glycosyltransferase n=2 Tax=Paenibacillus cellulosilyticus TaxID=375489 RepID=A0A2V2Z468_9BACL|nr:cellulose synthase/poly-beta-1,6-N-acetylglucosamine synthase-like glycosyltransferase [Paenibacillus cellulosilyticus]QKS48674.1 glycosyltransferase family 2 protein [Paenibacillus cellulosilyticus]
MYIFWKFILYFSSFCMIYTIAINLFYNGQMLVSVFDLFSYLRKMKSSDYKRYIGSKNMIPISIIVPAYNEEKTIVDNIKSLLALDYYEYEIIVVNDGSKDSTRDKIIEEFGLTLVNQPVKRSVQTKDIRGIYRSPQYERIILVDKENGGKADALNAGINVSSYPIFASIDADSILENEALIKLTMIFVEHPETVAVGGIVRLANGSIIKDGKLIDMRIPKSRIASFQIVEYLRAFLTGRTSLSRLNSILIISGAFGAFNKSAVIEVGGYKANTIGEDMDIIIKLHEKMKREKRKYKIKFLADPICWTQAPESLNDLRVQRRRWQIGLFDNLIAYRGMLFRKKYGAVGLLTLPYYWLFELFGPVVEFLGYIFIPMAYLFGLLEFNTFLIYFIVAFLLGTALSMGSILLEQISFRKYTSFKDIMRLVLFALLENLGYRQLTILFRIEGILKFRKGRHAWGSIKRKQFVSTESK